MHRMIDPTKTKKILLVRTDRLGDVVVTTPVFSAIKAKYPDIFLGVMVSKPYLDLVRGNPYVDEVLVYDKEGSEKAFKGILRFALELRRKRYNAAVHFHPRNRSYWTSWLAGIPIRIGYRYKQSWLLTHAYVYDKPEGKKHEAQYSFDLLRAFHISEPRRLESYVPLHPEYRDAVERCVSGIGPYVAFNPSASSPSKIWPARYFAEVADELAARYGLDIVITGGEGETRFSESVKQNMKSSALDLTGKLGVGQLAWLLKGAKLLISNDTGPVHIASALDTPVISIFGRTLAGLGPRRWKPLGIRSYHLQKDIGCMKCLADDCEIDFRCLTELRPNDVMTFIDQHAGVFSL